MAEVVDELFLRLVAEDVKNKVSSHQREFLRQPKNWDKWEVALRELVSSLDSQLEELSDRQEAETDRLLKLGHEGKILLAELEMEIDRRQKKISRFRFYVESRLDEVARLRAIGSGPDPDAGAASFFRNAISKHREMIANNDMEFSEVDEALWATLDGYWNFDSVVIEDDDE